MFFSLLGVFFSPSNSTQGCLRGVQPHSGANVEHVRPLFALSTPLIYTQCNQTPRRQILDNFFFFIFLVGQMLEILPSFSIYASCAPPAGDFAGAVEFDPSHDKLRRGVLAALSSRRRRRWGLWGGGRALLQLSDASLC